jgi:hypothetical protein
MKPNTFYLDVPVQVLVVECGGAEGRRQRPQLTLHALPLLQHLLQPRLDHLLLMWETAKPCGPGDSSCPPCKCTMCVTWCHLPDHSRHCCITIPALNWRLRDVLLTVACDRAFILERAAERRLARTRLALAGSTLGSRRGSSCRCIADQAL